MQNPDRFVFTREGSLSQWLPKAPILLLLMAIISGPCLSACSRVAIRQERSSADAARQVWDGNALVGDYIDLTETDIQVLLMEFADSYMESVGFVADRIHASIRYPESRSFIQGAKVFYISSAISIAADPKPVKALMDMMVLLAQQRDALFAELDARQQALDGSFQQASDAIAQARNSCSAHWKGRPDRWAHLK